MLRIALDYILGFKTSLKGITIEPHIPSQWKEFRAERKFRGKTIRLHVVNPNGKTSGFTKMTVNYEEVNDNFIDVSKYPNSHIDVWMML
jgi:cellobiose phosphorylase